MSNSSQEINDDYSYAPVVIPTLCRYDHFKQCIESLSHCTWAEKTDVYVGLDYPAKESHWEGYRQIKSYLETASFNFKSLNVVVREKNYGFGPNGNLRTLLRQIFDQYENFIMTEDDNVFSPNFLVFVNKGLKKFKNDKSVFSINGYKHFYPIQKGTNTFFRQNAEFSAWGYGAWTDKYLSLPPTDYFRNNFSLKKFFDVKKNLGKKHALLYWSFYFKPFQAWFDCPLSIYAYLENIDFISPADQSLVRNIGWDGSGEHCAEGGDSLAQRHLTQPISEESDFDYEGDGFEFYKENQAIFRDYSYAKISTFKFWKRFCKYLAKYVLIKLSIMHLETQEQ